MLSYCFFFILAVSQVAKKFSGIIPADKISNVEEEYEEFQNHIRG